MAETVVHVIDDDPAMRDSLAFLLETAGLAVRTYESAPAFLAAAGRAAGCVLTDVRMPQMTGVELVKALKAEGAAWPVVVMTGHGDVPLAVEAMKLGVVDFIEKPFDDEVLLAAIQSALNQDEAQRTRGAEQAQIARRMASLTGRETEVLNGLVAGHANKMIAYDLGISPRTVEIYRANVMTKMQAASLSELVRMSLLAQRGEAT